MMLSAQLSSAAVTPRARARASQAVSRLSPAPCPSSCSAFARGHAALRVKRAVPARASAPAAPSCSLFGSGRLASKKQDGPAWSPLEEGDAPQNKLTVFDWIQDAFKKLRTPALALALVAALALTVPDAAHAARSGGRVGGSSFRSSSSASYSRGSSSTHSSSSGYSRSYSSSAAPSIGTPRSSFALGSFGLGWGMPFGWGMGPAVVVGPAPVYYSSGPSFFSIIAFALFAVVAFSFLTSFMGAATTNDGVVMGGGERVAVAKLQIGCLGIARSLQKDLDKIAERADTSSPEGLHYVLQETVLSLLRHPDYCVYGASEARSTDLDGAEELFNEMSLDERSKLGGETLVNSGGVRKSGARAGPASDMTNEYIVITIIVAAEGNLKLPKVNNLEDLKTALKRLGAVRADGIQAVEVLWTPQQDGDTLTQQELLRDYPLLNNL